MEAPCFPVPFSAVKARFDFTSAIPKRKTLGSAEISFIPLNHLNGGFGLKIVEEGRTFVFLTDNELDYAHKGGLSREDYVRFSQEAELLMHDAQYTEEEYERKRGWGHSTFSSTTELAIQASVKRLGLFHHDPEHSDDDIDGFVARCRGWISQSNSGVECFGVQEGMEIVV
jgi:ribonuclease BN (tRNA processing enzyme)